MSPRLDGADSSIASPRSSVVEVVLGCGVELGVERVVRGLLALAVGDALLGLGRGVHERGELEVVRVERRDVVRG